MKVLQGERGVCILLLMNSDEHFIRIFMLLGKLNLEEEKRGRGRDVVFMEIFNQNPLSTLICTFEFKYSRLRLKFEFNIKKGLTS